MLLQDWWKASAEDETGADVSVTYKSIIVTYDEAAAPVTPDEPADGEDVKASKYGDVNLDGDVDIMDVISLNKYLLGSTNLDAQAKANADVNASGTLDSTDSLIILKCVVDMISPAELPYK